jgi:peptidoglycan/xylan/chitin deacetylase (PgdA/CDA1 family)
MCYFIISLDFELMWGVTDAPRQSLLKKRVLIARVVFPNLLLLFRKYHVRATWATVGLLLSKQKSDLLSLLPARLPAYAVKGQSPYSQDHLCQVGKNEKDDPYHYGLSIAQLISATEGMEIGSHTHGHYYCLERGQDEAAFVADLQAAIHVTRRVADSPVSIVFPRHQINPRYLNACLLHGFLTYRGVDKCWMYGSAPANGHSLPRRGARWLDSYVPLSGTNIFTPSIESGLVKLPASRYFRPYQPCAPFLEASKFRRIIRSMDKAAREAACFHLWWHPEDFATHTEKNLEALENVLRHYAFLNQKYGMRSATMGEVARAVMHGWRGLSLT